jgi:putative endonuclease
MSYEQVCGVYILASPDHYSLYTGMSTMLPHRIQTHKDGVVKGWARDYNCTKLVYYEFTENEEQGLMREKEIKAWSRWKKKALIETKNPEWKDLLEDLIVSVTGY